MDSTTLEILFGTDKVQLTNEKDLVSKRPSTFIAYFKGADKVFNLFTGKVIYIGCYKGMSTLSVSVSDGEIMRYLNLHNIQVVTGDIINPKKFLGEADSKNGFQLEYCSQWQAESVMPVRINNRTFFKQNPMNILNGQYKPTYNKQIVRGYTLPDDTVELTDAQKREFSGSNAVKIEQGVKQITSISEFTPAMIEEFTNNY